MKLRTKLILAFLIVALTAAGISMTVAVWSTKDAFDQYIEQQVSINAERWKDIASNYYLRHETLQGLQDAIHMPMGQHMGNMRRRVETRDFEVSQRTIILDQENKVVLDTNNDSVNQLFSTEDLKGSEPIALDGQQIGTLLVEVSPPPGVVTLEEQFLASVYRGFRWSAALAILLAIGVGILFAQRLVSPIEHLTDVVKSMKGNVMKYRAQINTEDEIGTLAVAFNKMADELENNLKLKGQLVADVSHELRTPITILRGNLESIQAGVKEPTQELILSMNDEVIRLSRLIADLQQLSLLDFEKLEMNRQPSDLTELVKKIIPIFYLEAEDKGIEFEITSKGPVFVEIDTDRIKQVLINLISNAMRYSQDKSKVRIDITSKENSVTVKIFDWGQGISKDEIKNIFERFYRTDKARSRQQGGTGLGLAITKGVIEAHGGKIWAQHNEPRGTVFIFEIPKGHN
ncbi:signal transduction histidine kinase [Desulfitispora alkaliphila]|uniref:sensor histidine kinase n=1 Tax=Desulfitispora alkaliphila TaxID=622674 RepID=UPI003D232F99